MLTHLYIKNFALIDTLDINFNSEMSVITGETGAGKSIILGALGLVLGQRADLKSLMNHDKKCIIEAEFTILDNLFKELFYKNDLNFEEHSIFRREILPSGKSRAFINDTPVNIQQLKLFGDFLVDIHSQNDKYESNLIDDFAQTHSLVLDFQLLYKKYKEVKKELESLVENQNVLNEQYEYIKFQNNELSEILLEDIKIEELEQELKTISNAEEIKLILQQVVYGIDESEENILKTLLNFEKQIEKISTYSETYNNIYSRLQSNIIELKDIVKEINNTQNKIDYSPEKMEEIQDILNKIYLLQQKHRVQTIDELIELRNDFSSKLTIRKNLDEKILLKQREMNVLEEKIKLKTEKLSQERKKIIPKIESEIKLLLNELGMPYGQLKIEITECDIQFSSGKDKIQFLFNANKGNELKPLYQIASGGEFSRVMLCLKYISSQYRKLPTIVFDEIDTGVSGNIASKIGNLMSKMSNTTQIIAITHLPQIAAKGKNHFKVFKNHNTHRTKTNIKQLSYDQRIDEIAFMISNNEITETSKSHAKELLGQNNIN